MCFGIAFGSFVSYASSAFQTKYIMALDPSFDFQTLVIILGIINGTTYAGGAFFGAKLADKWGATNVRAYGWLPAIAIGVCLPVGIASFWVPTVVGHLALTTVFLLFLGIYLGPSFAIAQTLAPINMRAMSTALFFFILNMIALGGGPTFTGWLIDVFKEGNADLEAMRYAMTVTCLMFIPSIVSFLMVARVLPNDWAAAEKRNQELNKAQQ
jgi:MFS family permease